MIENVTTELDFEVHVCVRFQLEKRGKNLSGRRNRITATSLMNLHVLTVLNAVSTLSL